MKVRSLCKAALASALLLMATAAYASGPPQSDDFEGTSLKSFWKAMDLGQSDGGTVTVSGGKLRPVASGADVWTNVFQVYSIHQTGITGDFEMRVRVEKTPIPDDADGWSMAGLWITSPDNEDVVDGDGTTQAPWVMIGLSCNNGIDMKWGAWGESTNVGPSPAGQKPPVLLRLVKKGNLYSGYYSLDNGATWVLKATTDIPQATEKLPDPVIAGIFVQSHDGSNMGDPILDDFQAFALNSDPSDKTAPAAVTDLAATATAYDTAKLTWTVPADAYEAEVRRSLAPITEETWSRATVAAVSTIGSGTAEVTATGLEQLETYYFALKTSDTNGNWSPVSNTVSIVTPARPPVGVPSTGLLFEQFNNIGGTAVTDLVNNSKWPNGADVVKYIGDFDTGTDLGDNYGLRLRGYITAPETGDYIFGISGDDAQELWLSTDENPANATLIATVSSWTNHLEWEKEPNQTSDYITLQAGRKYYIEARGKEGTGGDSTAVRWFLPDGTEEAPIPASRLSPFVTSLEFGRIRGTLTQANGRPLPNSAVSIVIGGDTYSATTNADGVYSVLVGPGAGEVTARFMAPWDSNTLKQNVTAAIGQMVTADFAFNLNLPPFIPEEKDAALSDDFSGSSLNAKWTSEDIGTTEPGDAAVVNGELVITANGADIWDGGDNFRYTYQEITGDFEAVLKVLTVPDTDPWCKSGLMVRETVDYDSYHYLVAATRDNGLAAQGRINPIGGDTPENVNTNGGTFTQGTGYWVKLIRQGQKVSGFKSANGVDYEVIRTDQHPGFAAAKALLGIAVTSHLAGTLGESRVDDFIVSKTVAAPVPGTPVPPVVKGDVDGNGQLAILDVVLGLRIVAGLATATPENLAGGDLNANGRIEITEVIQILRAVAGLTTL